MSDSYVDIGCWWPAQAATYADRQKATVHVGFEPGVERGVRAIAAGLGSACEGLCGYLPTH